QEVDGKTMTVMAKTSAVTEGNITTHTYTLPVGNYRFLSMSKDGPDNDKYYNWDKNFIVTYSDVLAGGKTIDADPGLLASAPGEIEWEQKRYNPAYFVRQFTDEVLARPESNVSDELKAKYPLVFTTPTYTNTDKARHQYTTQSELENFLATLDAANDEMYTYAMNKTDEGRNLMAAIFTLSDISGKTLAEAAEIVKANGKPTVQVSAQVHGDEQRGTEGTLATIAMLCGEYGESVLGKVNVIIMPRMNPDGSKIYKYESGSNHRSVTRDHMSVTRVETRTMIGMYNLFEPEVVLDQHEFRPATQNTTGAMPDIKICETHNLNLPQQLVALEAEFVANQVEKGTEEGFRVDFYRDGVIETSPAATKDYYALRGSISILHEIPGQRKGRQQWERRTMAHFLAIKNTIDFTAANAERVNETVAKTKADIAKMGKVYDESALITLLHEKGTTFDINRPSFNFSDGSYVNKDNVASISKFDKAVVTRPRPTSYVIPKDTAKIAEILDVVSVHGIKYSELPAGTTLEVRGYTGDHWGAALTEAKEVTFANGAYEFPVAQESGIILTLLMEPDMLDGARAVTDEAERTGRPSDMHKNSFAQQNLLPIAELFRCEALATHELSYVAPKAASCTEAGNIAHYICTCGAGFAANEHVNALEQDSWIIPAKGHNIKPAGAWEPYTCANGCGMSEKYFLDALALCAQAGGTITFPDGTVSYNGPLVIPTGVTLDLNGACAESDLIVNNGAAVRNGTILHKTGEDGNTVSLGSNGGYVPVLTSSVGSTDTYTLYSAAAKTGKDVSYFDNGTKYTFGYKFDDAAADAAAAAAGAERIKFGVNIDLQAGGVDADYSFSEASVAKMSEVGTGADDFFKVNLKLTGEQVDDVVATPYIKVKALGFRMEGSASTDYVEPTNVAEVDGV
ncbi:MAG: hypothetical protein IIX99_00825, partial [Oscillospiraceae bacterium]|nr:hypothetical protein [Oscillospiraceae bacterium]